MSSYLLLWNTTWQGSCHILHWSMVSPGAVNWTPSQSSRSSGKEGFLGQWLPLISWGGAKMGKGEQILANPIRDFFEKWLFPHQKGKRGIFRIWPPKNMIFRFFHKKFQFLDFSPKGSKYSSFGIFGVIFEFLAPGRLIFRFLPKKFQISDFSPKRLKIL